MPKKNKNNSVVNNYTFFTTCKTSNHGNKF